MYSFSSWFIPAIGWWVIAALMLLIVLLLFAHWRRYQARQRQQQFWRIAQQQLKTLDQSLPHAGAHISQILKQVIMTASPQHNALRLSGRDWQSYLQQSFADVATSANALQRTMARVDSATAQGEVQEN